METFYLSHGAPTLAIDETVPARKFFQSWQQSVFKEKPSSILVISAHWETAQPTVNVVDRNDTIYDFYGFPKPLYQIKYTPPGAPKLARRVKELLMASGIDHVDEDKKRGLDHGAWVPLMFMYPEADIPVCQLSVQSRQGRHSPLQHGKGSGPSQRGSPVPSWAMEFDNWLKDALIEGRYEDVNHYESKAPHPKMAHPWPDHFYPLHVAMGAAGEDSKARLVHSSWTDGTLSYASYQFTQPK
ncbi:hypothetical protein OIU85_027969 [Salix viminalis]|uniref:Extradiol ring-cleavage dioxygenase class III enzyme subunit B domain-containing protein n=1 Tax=Salix viminalis TaxID=40686 RepID=A0A9Q0TBJ0_SALVM|nr:hypothetical protein OIU85_027969 [Salix viminalis]